MEFRRAAEFITPLTLQTLSKNPIMTSFFDEKENWRPGHIELADRANLLLVAPATAHIIAELAHGLAHHPLAAIALATRAPILIAPAMNGKMWLHPATVENVEKLKSRGVEFLEPVRDAGFGLITHFKMPGDMEVQLYQPRYTKKPK